MRVAINGQLCTDSSCYRNAGISQYIRQVVTAMSQLPDVPDMHLFVSGSLEGLFTEKIALHRTLRATAHPLIRIVWEQCVLPQLIVRLRFDVFHSPAYVLPVVCPCRSVVTVLDAAFIRHPETFPRLHRKYLTYFTGKAVRKADAVIVISESTRRDVVEIFGALPEKVVTIFPGVSEIFKPASDTETHKVRRRYGLRDSTVLYLGTIEPRKNVTTLVAAFAEVRRALGGNCELVIAGAKGWGCEGMGRLVDDLGIADAVRFIGYVPGDLLPALYSAASVFVYPSLYEGFGLPPLEAMACGTPVITSNTSSLPEVVGDAGIMVDPRDTDALAEAIVNVLRNKELCEEMRFKGLARAKKFSWEETARRTLKVYENVHSGNSRG